ncbi:MAG TPA: hypothetical protein VEL51_21575 [Vicinamibacterales bacterium]|nr:hypothetical protein [Vicinamibacterales bacterium]
MAERVDDRSLDTLFREAQTHYKWLPRPISDDKLRELYELLKWAPTSANADGLQIRSQLLLRALRWFYTSFGAFAASALIAVLGSALATIRNVPFANAFAIVGLMVGTLGVTGLVIGCMLMVRETRLAVRYLTEEAKLALR